MSRIPIVCCAALLMPFHLPCKAQFQPPQTQQIPADEALDRAQRNNTLTFAGTPFHAVLHVQPIKDADTAYNASIELFWQDALHYRLILQSQSFSQTLIADGDQVMETDTGDFYPNWLNNFVTAIMDPMPRAGDLRGSKQTIAISQQSSFSCVRRDDRPGGITDEATWASVCFSGDQPQLEFAIDFTYNMEFHDFKKFHKKQVARTYVTGTGDHQRLQGSLVVLEDWTADPAILTVTKATAAADRILTRFVSTTAEESMVESAPTDVVWPPMREGKPEGYMIVEAVTDRTGQVRETSKHNSDNPGLESFGRLVALKYKFKPLLVDGVPQQMITPLVLHFKTSLTLAPLPELDDAATRTHVLGCTLPHQIDDPASAGQQITIQFQVSDDGHLMTIGASDRKIPVLNLFQRFHDCRYAPFLVDGKPSAYHANLSVTAR